jgi:hypothetical protein
MYNYDWDYFPARLHTTREIIYFLENIHNIGQIFQEKYNWANFIFGDSCHPFVSKDFQRFIHKKIDKDIRNIIFEISSRKVLYYKEIPINHFYAHMKYEKNLEQSFVEHLSKKSIFLTEIKLTDEDIEYDIDYIIKLCRVIFNENIQIHLIPHLNLKLKTNTYIEERNKMVLLLTDLANKQNIHLHDIGKYIEETQKDCFLESYMPDSFHYDETKYIAVKKFLAKKIQEASILYEK